MHERSGLVLVGPYFDRLVGFDLRIGVGGLDVVGDGILVHLGIVDGVDAAFLPSGKDAIEKEVDGVEFAEGA